MEVYLKYDIKGWIDGSEVRSTDCFSRGPRFNYQHSYCRSQLSVFPILGHQTPSSDLHGYFSNVVFIHTYRPTLTHIIF